MLNKKISIAVGGALLALASASASAAVSVILSPVNPTISGIGNNSATVTLRFVADGVAASHSGALNFSDPDFNILTLTTVGAGALCTLGGEDGAGLVTIAYTQASATAIPAGTSDVCTFVIDHVGAAAIVSPYTFTGLNAEDDSANPVAISGTNDNVTVTTGPAVGPTITYTPVPGGTVTFPTGAVGAAVSAPITLAMAGGSNSGTTTLGTCSSSIGGVVFTDSADTCTAGGACVDGDLTLQCTLTAAVQNGTAQCTETRQDTPNPDVVNVRTWNITCPAGNQAPTLTAAPNFDADATSDATPEVTLPPVGIGMTASSNVVITAAGQSGAGSATMSACAGLGGISVAPASLTFNANGSQNLAFSCTAAAAPFSGTVSCTETDFDSAGVTRLWDVLCQAGTPESAPGVTYAPAAASTLTFAQGASLGAITTQNVTVDINGGVDGGDANPESMSVSCTTVSAGYSLSGAGPYSANSPAAVGVDGTVTVSCAAAAAQQLGTLTCTETPSIDAVPLGPTARTWNLDCPMAAVNITANPAEGAIALVGPPNSNVAGSINLTNTGSASTLSCTATGAVTLGAVPASVPAGGAAAVPYTCLTGAAGLSGVGTIQCLTQDAAPDDVLDYTVSCLGLASVPVPAVTDFGKVLPAALVIGLGLLGLGARRQMI